MNCHAYATKNKIHSNADEPKTVASTSSCFPAATTTTTTRAPSSSSSKNNGAAALCDVQRCHLQTQILENKKIIQSIILESTPFNTATGQRVIELLSIREKILKELLLGVCIQPTSTSRPGELQTNVEQELALVLSILFEATLVMNSGITTPECFVKTKDLLFDTTMTSTNHLQVMLEELLDPNGGAKVYQEGGQRRSGGKRTGRSAPEMDQQVESKQDVQGNIDLVFDSTVLSKWSKMGTRKNGNQRSVVARQRSFAERTPKRFVQSAVAA